jgi:hypothetical protein
MMHSGGSVGSVGNNTMVIRMMYWNISTLIIIYMPQSPLVPS